MYERAGDGASALRWSASHEPTVARHPVDVGFATTEVKRRPGRRDRTHMCPRSRLSNEKSPQVKPEGFFVRAGDGNRINLYC